jgi:hypothetical protein
MDCWLPLGVNLRRRGLEVDTVCPLCRRLDEYSGHLPECQYTKSIRKEANLKDTTIQILDCTTTSPDWYVD